MLRRIAALTTFIALVAAASLSAQQQMPKNKDPNSPLNNDDVIQMSSLGLPDNLIISKIKSAKSVAFDTTPAGLKALSDAKVHDLVVQAVISKQDGGKVDVAPAGAPAAAAEAPAGDPNDPMAKHDSGVYIFRDGKMLAIDAAMFSGDKGTNPLKTIASQGFAKNRQKAVLKGAHAANQLTDANPVFYFYFDKDDTGGSLMQMTPEPKSPKEYLLVKLEVTKNERLLETMETGMTGSDMNAISKFAVKFTYTKIGPGTYKMTVDQPLAAGEYCFIQGGGTMGAMATNGHIWDFGFGNGAVH